VAELVDALDLGSSG